MLEQRKRWPLHAGAEEVVPTAHGGRGGGTHCRLGQRRWWPLHAGAEEVVATGDPLSGRRPRASMCPLATLCTERYYSYVCMPTTEL